MFTRTELGGINISEDVIASIIGAAATSCLGVRSMTLTGVTDGIVRFLKRDMMSRGVVITPAGDPKTNIMDVELHIAVNHGINIPAVCSSIISEVKYNTERLTGVRIGRIDICVDSVQGQ